MALSRDEWVDALTEIYKHLQAVRDLSEVDENTKAAPVGISGQKYEFAMPAERLDQSRLDLIIEAQAALDILNAAIKKASG